VSDEEGSNESMIDILSSTELRKSKPEDNNRLKKVIESYH